MLTSFAKTFWDRWEYLATKTAKRWQTETPPQWRTFFNPSLLLKPTERYTLSMYARESTYIGLAVVAPILLAVIAPLAYLFYQDPEFYRDPRFHKAMIGSLSTEGVYSLPLVVGGLLVFNAVLYLPRFYFWNRRAARLRIEMPEQTACPVISEAADPEVWPPPPSYRAV